VRGSLLAVLALAAFAAAACGYSDPYASTGPVANESPATAPSPSPGADDFYAGAGLPVVTYPDGLKYIDLTVGTGDIAVTGENATMLYTGWLSTGVKFDSSRDHNNTPFTFQLGQNQVISGWDQGIPGMKVGGKRKLIIPSALGYGVSGQTDPNTGVVIIPGNATLVFEVELTGVAPGPSPSPVPTPTPSPSPSSSPSPSPSAT
jgi:FKBP-type peptidyl-prolyl cis-trans isomerase FkpA